MDYNADNYNDDSFLNAKSDTNPVLKNVRIEITGGPKTAKREKQLFTTIIIRIGLLLGLLSVVFLGIQYIQQRQKKIQSSLATINQESNRMRTKLTAMKRDDPIAAENWQKLSSHQQQLAPLTTAEINTAITKILTRYRIRNANIQIDEFQPANNHLFKTDTIQTQIAKISINFKMVDDSSLYNLLDDLGRLDSNLPGLLVFSAFKIARNANPLRYYDEIRISEGSLEEYSMQVNITLYWYNLSTR